jgi:hypothetical protein
VSDEILKEIKKRLKDGDTATTSGSEEAGEWKLHE